MALSAKLELRQSHQLVMTPQLQQAIRLLQLSNIELNTFVETEIERNPLLERDDEGPAEAPEAGDRVSETDVASESDELHLDQAAQTSAAADDLDSDYDNVFPDTAPNELGVGQGLNNWTSVSQKNTSASMNEDANLEAYATKELSLKDHLTSQLNLTFTDSIDRLIGGYLIDLIDEAGYLRSDLAELALKLGTSQARVEAILGKLQTFDPPGVFARDLKECLALQLKERKRYDPLIAKFLDCLPLLAAHNLPALRRAIGCDQDDLSDMIAEIKQLNPKPGLGFGSEDVHAVVPDVLVRSASDGSWLVELNSDTLPRVLVNRSYYARVNRIAGSGKDKDKDKEFLLECLNNANWLVKSLDQRARTILRVAEEIIRQQDGFLAHGVQHLRPLNLKTIADAIKMHEFDH